MMHGPINIRYREEFFTGPIKVNISIYTLTYANISLYFIPMRYLYSLREERIPTRCNNIDYLSIPDVDY